VTLVARDGRVIADSHVPVEALDTLANHGTRPEVVAAWEGGIGFAERPSATIDERLLYAAMPVRLDGQEIILRVAAPLDDVDASVRAVERAIAFSGLLATLLAAAVAYFLSRAFTRPLVVLSERSRRLAQGDFSQRVPRGSRVAELDELAVGFNRLADDLQQRLAELGRERDEMTALIDTMAEGVVALSQDARVTRANRAAVEFLQVRPEPLMPVGALVRQPELRALLESSVSGPVEARELRIGDGQFLVSSRQLERGGSVVTLLNVTEVRRLEQVRRDFVANVSHELKTPLTAIRGFAETLLEEDPPEDLRRQFLEMVRRNTLRLQRLVDDLLDLARLEAGRWEIQAVPIDVGAVALEVWEPLAPAAQEKGVTFRIHGGAVAQADDQGLGQIFQNLFDNALRYTPEGGRIDVSIDEDRAAVRVSVSDTGSGIPARSLPRIFERFYRVDPGRARDAGGTGLGLAIVRHLVQSMGGEVAAESELGRGTTLRFTLPKADE
jgi:two-component system, OmpR family, phosphate regulon sensor histidine kinase PhoR